jgi:hypothetical protein
VADLVHHRRHVQQRLGGDAADVQAHAAQGGIALDDDGLQAEVGGAEGGRIATRAGAEHQHVAGRRRPGRSSCPLVQREQPPAPVPQRPELRQQVRGPLPVRPQAAPAASSVSTTEPWLTLSPRATLISFTTPAVDEGISIEALSTFDGDQALLDLHRVAGLDHQLDHRRP